jgi:hypothetical protein
MLGRRRIARSPCPAGFPRESSSHFSFVQAFVVSLIHQLHEPAWNFCQWNFMVNSLLKALAL